MPLFRVENGLVYYAHVPKCGGLAVSWYLAERFGAIAFQDKAHLATPPAARWSRTSPQHIDRDSLARLFPEGFFDAVFTIVRHPVARMVSAYHFQREVEGVIPESTGFGEWLEDLAELRAEDPFVHDNHVRPMAEIVPDRAEVFHMEHGLDALVPWLDGLTGRTDGPRAIPRINERGSLRKTAGDRVTPGDADLERIATLYAEDFRRFGYRPDRPAPETPAPRLTTAQIAERDAALRAFDSPVAKLRRKLTRRFGA